MHKFDTKEEMLPENPFILFDEWMKEAEKSEPNDPNAMCLATANKSGAPSARMVLLKAADERGFVFYTNDGSRKGSDIAENTHAALCFHWKSLRRQIRVEGSIENVSDEEADEYYQTRHRGSRIGAWASRQSQELGSYDELKSFVKEYEQKFENEENIPRPPYWRGFRIKPETIEFWIDGEYRLHRRYQYRLSGNQWSLVMLYP